MLLDFSVNGVCRRFAMSVAFFLRVEVTSAASRLQYAVLPTLVRSRNTLTLMRMGTFIVVHLTDEKYSETHYWKLTVHVWLCCDEDAPEDKRSVQ